MGAGEGDVRNVGVFHHPLAEVVTTGEDVHDTGGKGLSSHLRQHDRGEGSVGRRLEHDSVAGDDAGEELVGSHAKGEVPGGDAANDPTGDHVKLLADFIVFVSDLDGEFADVGKLAALPSYT